MATSGISVYQLTRDQLITAALRKLGVLAEGQTPSAQNITDASMALNASIAEFRGLGMPLWARKEYTFTPVQATYTIGIGQALNVPYPVRLLQAIRISSGARIDMEVKSRQEFLTLPANTTGDPIQVNYTPGINMGTVSFWPTPLASSTTQVTLVYQRPFEYSLNSADTFDFPEEWYNALIYKLAVLLAPEWGVPLQDRQMLKSEADEHLGMALMSGQEDGSLFIAPERRM